MVDMTPDHQSRAHAKLSASGSARWINCPGSPRMEAPFPTTSSAFADEGTAAHELGDMTLNSDHKDCRQFLGTVITVNGTEYTVDREMADYVQIYVDAVMSHMIDGEDCELVVEERFSLDRVGPKMFGTNDAAVINRTRGKLTILDLKYGQGVIVEAEGNTQLQYYALGALLKYGFEDFDEVEMVIVQPRAR